MLYWIGFTLWVVGLVLLLKYWRQLPDWAKVLGIIGLIPAVPGGPLLTIIVVLIGKNQNHQNQKVDQALKLVVHMVVLDKKANQNMMNQKIKKK